MSITRDFKLSLVAGRSVPLVINTNQYDDGEVWRFTLLDENGQKYSPSTGSIIGLKSDGHIIANAGTVSSTGLVIIPETEQMTASAGKNVFELLIDDDTHGTANFIVFVEPRPGAGGTPSDSDLAVFQEAIDAAATIGDVVDLVDDVAVLEARMDEFARLPDGSLSTAADAELVDIRVGADGTTYTTAGDAVRGQYSDLKNALTNLNDLASYTLTAGFYGANGVVSSPDATNQEVYTSKFNADYIKTVDISLQYSGNTSIWLAMCTWDSTGEFIERTQVAFIYNSSYSGTVTIPSGVKEFAFTFRTYGQECDTIKPYISVNNLYDFATNAREELNEIDGELSKKADMPHIETPLSFTEGLGITSSSTIGQTLTYTELGTVWKHATLSTNNLSIVKLLGSMISSGYDAIFYLDSENKLLKKQTVTSESSDGYEVVINEMPVGCAYIVWNYQYGKQTAEAYSITYMSVNDYVDNALESPYKNKTAVFFGTSIPAGAVTIGGQSYSIPTYVGKLLDMTVINESLGSSCARRGWKDKETANDTYGWTDIEWQNVFLAMGKNLTECQDLIDNYETKWKDLIGGDFAPAGQDDTGLGKPNEMDEYWSSRINASSYENKLIPYLDGTNPMPDLFIFEHGHNDVKSFDRLTISGVASVNPDNIADLDRSLFGDVMAFYIRLIWQANPQAKILIVSNYENDSATYAKVFDAQQEVAETNKVWFCDVANKIGWSASKKITTTGYWNNGYWVNSGGTSQNITMLNANLADGVHPSSDKSGNAIIREAEIIAEYIKTNIIL